MNAIFLKEVPDTVLKDKLVKLNHVDIGNKEYIIEINISNKVARCIKKEYVEARKTLIAHIRKISWIYKLCIKYTLNKFKRSLINVVNKNNLVGYSIVYSNSIKKDQVTHEYLESLFGLYSINEYVNTNTAEENLDKYVIEYINKNSIKNESVRPLIIVNDIESLNFDLVNKLNKKYKELNIYTSIKPNARFMNKIKNINDEYGSCISILNKMERDFKKYNIYIFVDKSRSEYSKCKFNKKACFIDFTNKENDRFNKQYIKMQNEIKQNKYNGVRIKQLYDQYGKITVSTIILS